mmetsp:Transcript_19771/g.32489  ORF Transcript_19771/g.32489 Transcript_19771/m.32489 type:complete len:87 (+) Transcript_19771:1133-1393(+)
MPEGSTGAIGRCTGQPITNAKVSNLVLEPTLTEFAHSMVNATAACSVPRHARSDGVLPVASSLYVVLDPMSRKGQHELLLLALLSC